MRNNEHINCYSLHLPWRIGITSGAHFGHCDLYTMVTVENNEITSVKVIPPMPHQQGGCMAPVQYLADNGVSTWLPAAWDSGPWMGFNQVGIEVFFGGDYQTVGDAVKAFIAGQLPQFSQQHTCGGGGA
ncbi:MAG: NifB/NifX family molybdenum-iron cluster-binding protein [Desulfobacterales bacterium]